MQLTFGHSQQMTNQLILRASHMTIGDSLRNNAKTIPHSIAIEHRTGKQTFLQLNKRVNRLANSFLKMGLVKGDRVAVLSENRLEYCELVYAAAKVGTIVPCLNWRLSSQELTYCMHLTTPETILVSSHYREVFEEIKNNLPFLKRVILIDDLPESEDEFSYASLIEDGSDSEPLVEVTPEDALVIIYTSGTTGYPKGAIVSHRAYFGRAWIWVLDLKLSAEDTYIGWSPMFHMAAMDPMLISGIIGAKYVAIPGFDPDKLANYLWGERLGWLLLMPGTFEPMIERLLSSNQRPAKVAMVGSMADLVPPEMIANITRLTRCPFLNTFGSTETGLAPATNSLFPVGEAPGDFAKKPNRMCNIRLVDNEDIDVRPGEPGELIIRGPSLCSGYWKDEEANRQAFKQGWYHMGDIFTQNADGKLNFVDRKKYLIKSGGENIYPAEIERVLKSHPGVEEAIVVRAHDSRWGEVPKAYVSRRNLLVDQDELSDLCIKKLAGYKKPRLFAFVDSEDFPRSTTGKILRHEVEKWNKIEN